MNRAAGRCEHRARLLLVLLGDRAAAGADRRRVRYLEPLAAVVFAAVVFAAALLHETMLPLQILGAVLILCGAAGGECVPMLLQRHQKC